MPAFKDLTGKRFGRLVAQTVMRQNNKNVWSCLCDCGNTVVVDTGRLGSGNTKSCGCLRKDLVSAKNTTHGMSKLPEYSHWKDMIKRVTNPNNKRYDNYASKDIIIDEKFLNSFEEWLDCIGRKPTTEGLWSVGRIDNTKGYVAGNMEWQLPNTQAKAHSKQKNNSTGVTGVSCRRDSDGNIKAYTAALSVDGVTYSKEFTTSKHANALEKAIEHRKYLMEIYGKSFHCSHGV